MDDDNGIPKDFGWRYILWNMWYSFTVAMKFIWRNAITIISAVSAVFTAITLDDNQTYVSHETFHTLMLANLVLTIVLAQIKRGHVGKDGDTTDTK